MINKLIYSHVFRDSRPAIILDRDGVINYDYGYVHNWHHFDFMPGVKEGLKRLSHNGHPLFIATNQSGIAREMFSHGDFVNLTDALVSHLLADRIIINGVYYCPHHPDGSSSLFSIQCNCRKPNYGMLKEISVDFGISLSDAIVIGDQPRDMLAAQRALCPIRILANSDCRIISHSSYHTHYISSFSEAIPIIENSS